MKLKTLLLTGLTALSMNALKAQDIKKTSAQDTVTVLKQKIDKDEDLLHLTSLYAGQITGIGFDLKNSENIDYYSSTRIGGGAECSLTKNNKLKVMGLVDLSPKQGESYAFGQAYIQTVINKNIVLNTGLTATPSTLLRAFPTSWGGQFEPATDKLIPGGALGARLDSKIDKVDLSVGVANRSGKPEYGMNVGYKGTEGKVNLALWINNQDIYGSALSGSWKSLTILGVINKTEEDFLIGGKLLYSMKMPGKTGSLVFFSTRNGNLQPELERTSMLTGVVALGTVNVGKESLHCMVGPAYDSVTNRIVVYLQLAFQR